jgi:hypothetical protein
MGETCAFPHGLAVSDVRPALQIRRFIARISSVGAMAVLTGQAACFKTTPPQPPPTITMGAIPEGQRTITPEELVALTEALADSYVGTVNNVLNNIQTGQPTTEVRTSSQWLRVFVATTAYSIATGPNPQIGLIDLTANISVQRMIWSNGLARERFGDHADDVIHAYDQIDAQAWTTLARLYSPQQLAVLRDGIQRWITDHPNYKSIPFVNLPELARYRDVTLLTTPGGLKVLAPVAEAARAAMELRLLGERSLYLAQRFPYLINWQSELFLYKTLETPEARDMLDSTRVFASSLDRMAGLAEQLPNTTLMQQTVSELNATLKESVPLLTTMRGVVSDLNQTLEGADRLLAPFQTPAVGGGPPGRTFDVNQYSNALHELGSSVRELNTLLVNTKDLVTSPELGARLDQIQSVNESGIGGISRQGNRFIDRIFWRAVILVVVFFAGLLSYRAASLWMTRRFPPRTER